MADILIIAHDSDAAIVATAYDLCKGAGHEVALATHGLEALSLLASTTFDLVVLDVRSPFQDGVALTSIIRERPSNKNLPIIAIAEELSCSEHMAMRVAGVDRVIGFGSPTSVVSRAIEDALQTSERLPSFLESYHRLQALVPAHRQISTPTTGTPFCLN